jgi:predicted DNA-binding transcriptional regulator AlpA
MAARTLDYPDKDWLDDDEVAALLGVSVKTLERMVAEDGFPEGIAFRGQTVKWLRDDLVYWRLWLERKHRLRPQEKPATNEDNRRQPRTTDAK